jgi:hypothetical protein
MIQKEKVLKTKIREKTTEIRRSVIEIPKGLDKNNKTNTKTIPTTTPKNWFTKSTKFEENGLHPILIHI